MRHVSPRTTRDDSAAIAELPSKAAKLVLNQCVILENGAGGTGVSPANRGKIRTTTWQLNS